MDTMSRMVIWAYEHEEYGAVKNKKEQGDCKPGTQKKEAGTRIEITLL
jgi:hypothetical protein